MKDYLNFEGLSHFLNKLLNKFSVIGHSHTKSEISDLEEMSVIATDDGNGNVSLICTSETATYNIRLNTLEEEVATLNSIVNDNEILVANNASN